MGSWLDKLEGRQEELDEEILNNHLQELIDLVDTSAVFDEDKMMQVFEEIVKIYIQLDRNNCEYDKKDAIFRKKRLAEMRYKKLKRDSYNSKESQSWNEFEDEEKIENVEEQER